MVQTRIGAYLLEESNGDECQDGSYSDNDIIPANSESKKGNKTVSKKNSKKKQAPQKDGKKCKDAKKSKKKDNNNSVKSPRVAYDTLNTSLTELLVPPTPMTTSSPISPIDDASGGTLNRDTLNRDTSQNCMESAQMDIAMIKSLESQIKLLESELSKCKKTDASQKTQIKKLTKDNERLRR